MDMLINEGNFTLKLNKISIYYNHSCVELSDTVLNNDLFNLSIYEKGKNIIGYLYCKKETLIKKVILTFEILNPRRIFFFRNGFQSWSPSMEVEGEESFPKTWFVPLKLHCYDPGNYVDLPKNTYISHFFTYIRSDHEYLYLIPMDNKISLNHFSFQPKKSTISLIIEIEKNLSGEIEFLNLSYGQKLDSLTPKIETESLTSWCSWYYYYTNISEKLMLKNLDNLNQRIPFKVDFFQVDDGWQKSIGDWHENNKFPKGLKFLVDKIKEKGYKAGIWMAPFVVERKSSTFQNKNWFLKDVKGRIKIAGFNPLWSGFFYALDPTHPEVINYLEDRIGYLRDCGFELFKFDFLYSLAIPGIHYRHNLSRREVVGAGLRLLRENIGDGKLIGCGAPLLLHEGLYDIFRVGPDVSEKWIDPLEKLLNFEGMVSAFNCLKNTLTRSFLNGRYFTNDSDVALLRNSKLSPEQKRTLIISNYFLSPYFSFSDPIDLITEDSLALIKELKNYENFRITHSRFVDKVFNFQGCTNNEEIDGWINLYPTKEKISPKEGFSEILKKGVNNLLLPFETRVFAKKK